MGILVTKYNTRNLTKQGFRIDSSIHEICCSDIFPTFSCWFIHYFFILYTPYCPSKNILYHTFNQLHVRVNIYFFLFCTFRSRSCKWNSNNYYYKWNYSYFINRYRFIFNAEFLKENVLCLIQFYAFNLTSSVEILFRCFQTRKIICMKYQLNYD